MTLSTVDWVIVAVLGISTLISLRRGFVKEALSLVTWIAAVLIARVFAGQFTVVLAPYIEMDSLRFGASFVVLFIATLMVGGMVNYLVGEFVRMTGLSGLDRLLGTFFGFARGGVIVLVVVALMHYVLPVEENDWYRQSQFIPQIVNVIEELGPVLWEQGEGFLEKNHKVRPGSSPEAVLISSPEQVGT
jgi:membrane protein required for colicin V production|tara:strand:- start:184 stop:750 length:567 start_codon:yes stop_codon:yes gene_type:complete